YRDYRPIVRVTGLHQHTCVFGALSMDGKQMFRQYDDFNANTFLAYLKQLHRKFPSMILFMDKARQHYRSKIVKEYLEKNEDTIRVVWFPNASPEFSAVEECWRQGEKDLLHCIFYDRFTDLKGSIAEYYRTKRFRLSIVRYLLREAV
ncbi:MAG: transposase, partial [Nitrososphaerales archaeon]